MIFPQALRRGAAAMAWKRLVAAERSAWRMRIDYHAGKKSIEILHHLGWLKHIETLWDMINIDKPSTGAGFRNHPQYRLWLTMQKTDMDRYTVIRTCGTKWTKEFCNSQMNSISNQKEYGSPVRPEWIGILHFELQPYQWLRDISQYTSIIFYHVFKFPYRWAEYT